MRTYGGYHYPLGRETFLVPVVWEDGWPVLAPGEGRVPDAVEVPFAVAAPRTAVQGGASGVVGPDDPRWSGVRALPRDRKSTRLNSSHVKISYAVFCLKKNKMRHEPIHPPPD